MKPEHWIKKYVHAWECRSTYEVSLLFTPDASYRSYIFDQPFVGRSAIQMYWDENQVRQRDIKVRTGKPIISADGEGGTNRAAVEWWTTMVDPEMGEVALTGVLMLKFDKDGLCRDLWEYWATRQGMQEPPEGWGK